MNVKRYRYTISAFLLSLVGLVVAIGQEPMFSTLEHNKEYARLKRENERMIISEDSITSLINIARNTFRMEHDSLANPIADIDSFSTYIIDLEQQLFDMRSKRGDIIAHINTIEQEWVLSQMFAPEDDTTEEGDTDSDMTTAEERPHAPTASRQHRNIIDNAIFKESLLESEYEELCHTATLEQEVELLCLDLIENYNTMRRLHNEYMSTDDELLADSLYTRFYELDEVCEHLDSEIERRWNKVLDTKYYTYGYILEKNYHYALLDSSTERLAAMQQRYAANEGEYMSDALMHYVIGKPTLLDYEINVAHELKFSEAADSLEMLRGAIPEVEYRLAPLTLERRLFIDYEPITYGEVNFYNAANPIPEVKVYERGTIYRIRLGAFRTKQQMSIFRGVQPLYIMQNEEGHYCYFTGGFATRLEADEAELALRERGFKAPRVFRWQDGEMIDLSLEEEESLEESSDKRYMINIETEELTDSMRNIIAVYAPKKSVSRRGGGFIVGTFTLRSDAYTLYDELSRSFPALNIQITEIELHTTNQE